MTDRIAHYPQSWDLFCEHAGRLDIVFFGFKAPLPDVNRFAARYRAARAFRGICLDGYTDSTAEAYGSLCRVMLVYSAFEMYLRVIGKTASEIVGDLEGHGAVDCLVRLKSIDVQNTFYRFIYDRVNAPHQRELESYFNNDPVNIAYLASAIRHIFAHGYLTPGAGGGDARNSERICNELSDFLLAFMDARFARQVQQGLDQFFRRE